MKNKIIGSLILVLFFMLTACKNSIRTSVDYKDPESLLITLLISPDVFDNEWSVEKIFDAQNSLLQKTPKSPVEFSTRLFWTYSNLLKDNVLVEHHLYRYDFLFTDIEDFAYTVNGEYSYIETDINRIALYQYCRENIKTDDISCSFAFIPEESEIVSALGVVFPDKNTDDDIYIHARLFFNQMIEAVKSNLVSLN